MDEPKKTQDVTTSENTEETSTTPETFTEEQVKERETKARSDALAEVGRLKKATEDAIKAATRANERIVQMLKDQEDAELEANRDDVEKISAIKERQARRRVESELVETRQKLEDEQAKTTEAQKAEAEHTKERNAREVATRLGVDAKTLIKFTDGSVEAMEDLAKSLPKKGEPLKPDSGKTTGGSGGIPTNLEQYKKWVENLSQSEYERLKPEIDKMKAGGKIR